MDRDLRLRFFRGMADLDVTPTGDLAVVEGDENLAQAIVCRLKTLLGELGGLGHPEYGSRLYEALGRPNNEATWRFIRGVVLEALEMEDRVVEVLGIVVKPLPWSPTEVGIEVSVLSVSGRVVGVSIPFSLEVE